MIQGFFRQSSALGRSSGFDFRMSLRKSTQVILRPALLTGKGGEDALPAYLHTSKRPSNRELPANIRYKIHPRAQISTRLVLGIFMSSISGAM